MNTDGCIVTTSIDDEVIAEKLARLAIDQGLAGCVQVVPGMKSIYEWQGKVEKSAEFLVQFKTLHSRYKDLMEMISKNHSYDVPEIIMSRIEDIDKTYHSWLKAAVHSDRP